MTTMMSVRRASFLALAFLLLLCQCSAKISAPPQSISPDAETATDSPPLPLPPAATAAVPLHATDGTHHVYVYVGSPPQRRTLIVDTGSRLMAFPCEPCESCGKKHASETYYDPAVSTTDVPSKCGECQFSGLSRCGEDDSCTFLQRYTEGSSLTAYEVEDLIWIGTDDVDESIETHMQMAVPFVFGCQTAETGLFTTQYADGIIGIAMHQTSILNAFHIAGSIPRNAFSLCLTTTGGTFSLGGTSLSYPKGRHLEPMQYTPLEKDHGWYAVKVESVHVGDVLVTAEATALAGFNDDKGTIIDSGTTDSYLPKMVAKPFMEAWEKLTGKAYSNKLERYTFQEFQSLPIVTITLAGGVRWSVRPETFMEAAKIKKKPGTSGTGTGAIGLATNEEKAGDFDFTVPWRGVKTFTNRMYLDEAKGCVLGGNAMSNHDILFDVTGKTIGIAKADCEYRSRSLRTD